MKIFLIFRCGAFIWLVVYKTVFQRSTVFTDTQTRGNGIIGNKQFFTPWFVCSILDTYTRELQNIDKSTGEKFNLVCTSFSYRTKWEHKVYINRQWTTTTKNVYISVFATLDFVCNHETKGMQSNPYTHKHTLTKLQQKPN